jgi:murein DD-endopeptidase MepM/ murein hydrolase activator NlpD
MPGGYVAGYPQDTGLDIGGFRLPVYAIAAGTLDYSEPGHTRWPGDDDKAVRLELDQPISHKGRRITHIWYAHLHELVYQQAEGAEARIRVVAGERIGTSGIANGSPHLHLGFLLDGRIRQRWGTYLLADEIRVVLGNYRQKERLPVARKRYRRTRSDGSGDGRRSLAPP